MTKPCRWNGTGRPRLLNGEHYDTCDGAGPDWHPPLVRVDCEGCWPCRSNHCQVCNRAHSDGTCTECIHATRENLWEIQHLCLQLPSQAVHQGYSGDRPGRVLGGDAMVALAMRYPDQNGQAGEYLGSRSRDESDVDVTPPIVVLVGWEDVWRDYRDNPSSDEATVGRALVYLNEHLSDMAKVIDVPFADFAKDLRQLRSRLQSIVHDQDRGDPAGVDCFQCGGGLERKLTKRKEGPTKTKDTGGFEDIWTCQRCRQTYTIAEYNFALRAKLEEAS